MASGALFGTTNGRSQNKKLVEFRAGKMYMKGKMGHLDKRKGQVYIYQSEDSLMHFCWKDRTNGNVEDDLIIFPDDVEFKHVTQCTTGRVFVLKFKSSTRKFFFWMQEPKTDKDDEHCKKVNDFLNNPPTPGSSRGGHSLPSDLANLAGDTDIQNILSGMSQQQMMQLLGGMGLGGPGGGLSALMGRPSSAQSTVSEPPLRVQSSPVTRTSVQETTPFQRPVTAAALPSQNNTLTTSGGGTASSGASNSQRQQIQLSDLQNILSSMKVPTGQSNESLDLAKALKPEAMIPILANPEVQQRLIQYLPEGEALPRSEQELRNTISSPQFQQALNSFSAALQSGQLGPLMTQFGLGEDVANAAAQGDLDAFVKAMQAAQKKKDEEKSEDKEIKETKSSKPDEKDDRDEEEEMEH